MRGRRRHGSSLTLVAVLLLATLSVGAKKRDREPLPENLTEAHRIWLAEVDLLITDEERTAFLGLDRDYQRESFIRRFWAERDPFADTRLNEFEENWKLRLELARDQFGGVEGDRAETLLLLGPPRRVHDSPCPQLFTSASIWEYGNHPESNRELYVVFARGGASPDGYRLWSPFEGLESLTTFGADHRFSELDALDRVASSCPRGRDLRRMLEAAIGRREVDRLAEGNPQPSDEWVRSFLGRLTDVPVGAGSLRAEFSLSYPGRRQNRTIVQALIGVLPDASPAGAADPPIRRFLVDGEVLRRGEPFESFRYRFELPNETGPLPIVIQRFLRPGDYILILRAQELSTDLYFRLERPITVPLYEQDSGDELAPGDRTAEALAIVDDEPFAEANEPLPPLEHRLRILPPPRELLLGRARIEAVASGEAVHKVTFSLNDRPVLSKLVPPYSVELNLGESPRLHTVTAVAYDDAGIELARDEIKLNSGPHRFGVRLVHPQPTHTYRRSLRIEAAVDLPEDETLDRVELYLGERRLATLHQPPFVQPIQLEESRDLTYVRAVAYLADGNSTEDLVFINSPDGVDAVQVDFVELHVSVFDRAGRPVASLGRDDFTVLENGEPQVIRRFETPERSAGEQSTGVEGDDRATRIRERPIHAGVLLDTSTSMENALRDVERAALRFFERIVLPRDRAAVIVFNDFPELRVPLTNSLEVLAGGLAGLDSEGDTALYDSLIYGLYYLAGIRGKRALIVLSDGADSSSRHTFDETIDFARRSGVAVYTIGLALDHRDMTSRHVLSEIARETGGRSFLVGSASHLERIYDSIEEELRSQYLIGYQSTAIDADSFREIELRVAGDGLEAKTIPGYYP